MNALGERETKGWFESIVKMFLMIVNMFYDWHWKEREDEWISEIDIILVIISFYNVHWMRERMGERMSERVRLESLFILKKARYKFLILLLLEVWSFLK